jgi:hypothetical protein
MIADQEFAEVYATLGVGSNGEFFYKSDMMEESGHLVMG